MAGAKEINLLQKEQSIYILTVKKNLFCCKNV